MPIQQSAKTRIVANITGTRTICLNTMKAIAALSPGDCALFCVSLAISNVAEVMLEELEVSKVETIPDGAAPVVRGN